MPTVWLLGHPVAHSRSPAMHDAAFAARGLADWRYEARDVAAADLPRVFDELRAGAAAGANVTNPHKRDAFELCDEIDPVAARAGAANTLVVRGGRVVGHNTDVKGVIASLVAAGAPLPVKRACVLGAGGAARAAVVALVDLGCRDVTLIARDPARAEGYQVAPWTSDAMRASLDGAAVLVNASAAGFRGARAPADVPVVALPASAVVLEMVYEPIETPLAAAARARGLAVVDGLTMLVRQGAASFKLWTGREAPIDVMDRAARQGG